MDVKDPAAGEVEVRNVWLSVDPYMPPRMLARDSYVKPFELGAAMEGGAIGTVVKSEDPQFQVDDVVLPNLGWREAFTAPTRGLRKVDKSALPLETYLSVAGMPGFTAYVGIRSILKVQPGEVVLISAASGAVGSVASQIAMIDGADVIGVAGGEGKCSYLKELGIPRVIDYKKTDDFTSCLRETVPDGIDCYFDNVGGPQLDAAMEVAKPFARIALCGMVSQYNGNGGFPGDFFNAIRKRLRLEGFIVSDHNADRDNFLKFITPEIQSGRIKWRQTVEHGIDQTPAALLKLFSGDNFGKMLVDLS